MYAGIIGFVDQMEANSLSASASIEPHRDRDQTKADVSFPNGCCHAATIAIGMPNPLPFLGGHNL
jgi:hypothetical protein